MLNRLRAALMAGFLGGSGANAAAAKLGVRTACLGAHQQFCPDPTAGGAAGNPAVAADGSAGYRCGADAGVAERHRFQLSPEQLAFFERDGLWADAHAGEGRRAGPDPQGALDATRRSGLDDLPALAAALCTL